MNRSALYDEDILEWSEQQAEALRRLARSRHDLSNVLDWEQVAEEIEDLGRSELATVQSLIRQILIHLMIKTVSLPDEQLILGWEREVLNFHAELLDRVSPSMPGRIDIDRLWRRAIKQAAAGLRQYGQKAPQTLPERSPVQASEIVAEDFDFSATVERVRGQLAAK